MSFRGISRALTVVSVGQDEIQEIVCVYCSVSEVDENELHEYCRDKLPLYMVPSRFLALDEMPTNANGKADRRALKNVLDAV